jgi:phospholipase/lecithinase/hemolysin
MLATIRRAVVLLMLFLTRNPAVLADSLGGIGVLGDSYSDEYQFYPPDRSYARNWVEILATARRLDFGRFDASTRGEPRNQGYAFNWARTWATTEDLIRSGQHTGLAAQVARGEVRLVVIFIGGNDFINALKSPEPMPALSAALPRALENYRTTVRTILGAGPKTKLVLVTVPDIRHLPEFAEALRERRLSVAVADACTVALRRYNAQIRSFAASDARMALIDLDLFTRAVTLLRGDYVMVAGRRLDRRRAGTDLDCLFLADGRHPGTIGQSLMASMFIEVVNAKFSAGVSPLLPNEILEFARSVLRPGDAEIGLAKLEGVPRVVSPAMPAAAGAEKKASRAPGSGASPDDSFPLIQSWTASKHQLQRRPTMFWFCCWMIAFWNCERQAEEATDWMKPPGWSGNFWGPAAIRARIAGELPPLPKTPEMEQWNRWGHRMLREGDVVFRLGDARAFHGIFALSWFISRATGSPFSHTAIVAVEDGSPVVYDSSEEGVRRMPFEVWMLETAGSMGVKRLKPEHRHHIPGVIGYCRNAFEQQVPFDASFRMDDSALYCLELTEKAFRAEKLALSEPVRIGDWERLNSFPLTAFAMPFATRLVVGRPITLEQPVYLPGNDRHGMWASPLLEAVFGPEPIGDRTAPPRQPDSIDVRGDLELITFAVCELRQSYSVLPVQWALQIALRPPILRAFTARHPLDTTTDLGTSSGPPSRESTVLSK